ncbi:MAG: bifunctional phosphoserine phosphatase/homoserine phosphotransferase ThrH, partial [Deltaproteobacteria bacterium]|nr:bifunctional phosphoserine phosphatase/homoserine phosphotransferase ThrH [Deltaproteobacteria bacterium]
MRICCLDLEGVLLPEIWIAVAEHFHNDDLRLTTRDISDYDQLMQYRLKILRKNRIRLADIQGVIGGMEPLPGARDFLDDLYQDFQVVLLSDTYYEFAMP